MKLFTKPLQTHLVTHLHLLIVSGGPAVDCHFRFRVNVVRVDVHGFQRVPDDGAESVASQGDAAHRARVAGKPGHHCTNGLKNGLEKGNHEEDDAYKTRYIS